MRALLLISLFVCAIASAQAPQEDKKKIFELSANNVTSRGSVVVAQDNAFMLSEDVYMYADKITYNREEESALLEGNVRIYRGGSLFVDAARVEMNLKTKHTILQPAYFQNENGMWFSGREVQTRCWSRRAPKPGRPRRRQTPCRVQIPGVRIRLLRTMRFYFYRTRPPCRRDGARRSGAEERAAPLRARR